MSYNALDQLVRVKTIGEAAKPPVEHAYGHDGQRVSTQGTDGVNQVWFAPGFTETRQQRKHEVRIGDRVIDRIM